MYGRREKAGGFDRVGQRLHSLLDSRRICCTAGIGARERRRARNERHARMYAPLIATMIATYTQIIHNDSRWDGWIEEGSAEGDRVSPPPLHQFPHASDYSRAFRLLLPTDSSSFPPPPLSRRARKSESRIENKGKSWTTMERDGRELGQRSPSRRLVNIRVFVTNSFFVARFGSIFTMTHGTFRSQCCRSSWTKVCGAGDK